MITCYFLVDDTKRRSYIGYTTRLSRRIRQHNAEITGGARYTQGRRWTCVACVTGFPSKNIALSFEWYSKRRRCSVEASAITRVHPRVKSWLHTLNIQRFDFVRHELTLHLNETFFTDHDTALARRVYGVRTYKTDISNLV